MKKYTRDEVLAEIEEKRNYSWIKEVYNRHRSELNRVILDYYGTEITYKTFLAESIKLAKAMKQQGISQGDEFVVCIDRIPEAVYLLGAANIIGANINFISEKFDENYIKQIIGRASNKTIFVQTNKTKKIASVLSQLDGYLNEYKIVSVSHRRSLKENNRFEEIIKKFYHTEEFLMPGSIDYDYYIESGKLYKDKVYANTNLDTPFTTTYSSGTTKQGLPKGIVHVNRHYIVMGRYHDPEVSGVPSLKNLTTYSNIPAYSNTFILSIISDNMILGGKIILDPIDDPNYFLLGVKEHKSHMNVATTSTWLINALEYYHGNKNKIDRLPEALFNFVAGEQLSQGEEKFINQFFRDTKCGVGLTHTPFSLATACTAGADCEHGSLFYRIFRSYFSKLPYRIGNSEPIGMIPYDFADIKVLRPDGTYCNPNEHGKLVANSPLTMKEYSHSPEETKEFYCKDAYGNTYGNMNVWGYMDEKGNVSMKGRYEENDLLPCHQIADEILKDTKKIMSCEVVKIVEGKDMFYVAHIMPQHGTSFNSEKVLQGALKRCILKFGQDIEKILFFRIRSFDAYYPYSASIKRNTNALKEEGLTQAFQITKETDKVKRLIKRTEGKK